MKIEYQYHFSFHEREEFSKFLQENGWKKEDKVLMMNDTYMDTKSEDLKQKKIILKKREICVFGVKRAKNSTEWILKEREEDKDILFCGKDVIKRKLREVFNQLEKTFEIKTLRFSFHKEGITINLDECRFEDDEGYCLGEIKGLSAVREKVDSFAQEYKLKKSKRKYQIALEKKKGSALSKKEVSWLNPAAEYLEITEPNKEASFWEPEIVEGSFWDKAQPLPETKLNDQPDASFWEPEIVEGSFWDKAQPLIKDDSLNKDVVDILLTFGSDGNPDLKEVVEVKISTKSKTIKVRAIVDTGCDVALVLNESSIEKLELQKEPSHQKANTTIGQVSTYSLGKLAVKMDEKCYSVDTKHISTINKNIIGMPLLRQYHMAFLIGQPVAISSQHLDFVDYVKKYTQHSTQ